MAEAYKEVFDGISKILECGICMSHLHKPKVLHCQHSFCQDCIDNILTFKPDGSAEIACPFRCAGHTLITAEQTSAQLRANYQLLGIVDMYKEKCANPLSTTGSYICHTCKDPVCIYCSDCHNFYCSKCERDHRSHTWLKITYNEPYGQYMPVCKEHDAVGNFICCKQIICVYCQNRKHNGHQYENLTAHALNIRQLFFNQDGSRGKIDKIMENAKGNHDSTVAALTDMKMALVETLKTRMFMSIANHVSSVEKEAVKIVEQVDKEICKHMQNYRDVTPSDFLKTVVERDNVELVVRREYILQEYSKYTVRVPSLQISLTDESPKESPLGNLKIEYGECIPIGNDNNPPSVSTTLQQDTGLGNVDINAMSKVEDLIKEVNSTDGKLSPSLPQITEPKPKPLSSSLPTALQEALTWLDIRGYDFIDDLCTKNKEELLIDMIKERPDMTLMKDNTGVTLLHSAAQHGFEKMLEFLLVERLTDINVIQKFKQTALHYAAYHNKVECVQILLRHNADTTLKNHKGSKPVDVARQYKSNDVLPILQQLDH